MNKEPGELTLLPPRVLLPIPVVAAGLQRNVRTVYRRIDEHKWTRVISDSRTLIPLDEVIRDYPEIEAQLRYQAELYRIENESWRSLFPQQPLWTHF